MHRANILRTSECVRLAPGSKSTPWHKQQTYDITYLLPARSAGHEGPSKSTMTSSQHSESIGLTATESCFVGRFRKRMHVAHRSIHCSTSFRSPGHHATRCSSRIV